MSSTNAAMGTAIGNATRNVAKNVARNVSKSSALSSVSNAMKKAASSDKMPMMILIAVTILLFIFVILYITFAMKSSSLTGKVLTSTPLKLDKLENPLKISNGDMPNPAVGREYSYCFWMYLEDFKQEYNSIDSVTTPMHKLIMYRGNGDDVNSANPLIFMDGGSNKLYVVIKTTESSLISNANTNLNKILETNYFSSSITLDDTSVNKHLIMAIDYVPLQRWVHVGLVVDNKMLSLFLDGELYSVKSVDEYKAARQPFVTRLGKVVDYNLIVEKSQGDMFIGKSTIGNRRTINGYIGKVEYFNYALTIKDVKKSYESGPLSSGFLSTFGITQYGFRSPVYKLNEVTQ